MPLGYESDGRSYFPTLLHQARLLAFDNVLAPILWVDQTASSFNILKRVCILGDSNSSCIFVPRRVEFRNDDRCVREMRSLHDSSAQLSFPASSIDSALDFPTNEGSDSFHLSGYLEVIVAEH